MQSSCENTSTSVRGLGSNRPKLFVSLFEKSEQNGRATVLINNKLWNLINVTSYQTRMFAGLHKLEFILIRLYWLYRISRNALV